MKYYEDDSIILYHGKMQDELKNLPIAKARILYGKNTFEYEMKKKEKETGQHFLDLWGDEK